MAKVIVITGASSGIGAALARRLARDGNELVLAARREQELKAVAAGCGGRCFPVVADVTRRALVNNLRDAAIRRFGSIDVWVNNALTANLRMDLRATHPGIHVSLVMPGVVTTDFPKNVLGEVVPPAATPGTPAQTADEVADCIAALIENPVPEIFTNPAQSQLARVYYHDVGAFEAKLATPGRP